MPVLKNPDGELNQLLNPTQRHISLPDQLVGDQIRLKQILINLTKNALKFTLRGEIKIRASYDLLNEKLIVHVIDTGIGINGLEKEQLFNMFGKVERSLGLN